MRIRFFLRAAAILSLLINPAMPHVFAAGDITITAVDITGDLQMSFGEVSVIEGEQPIIQMQITVSGPGLTAPYRVYQHISEPITIDGQPVDNSLLFTPELRSQNGVVLNSYGPDTPVETVAGFGVRNFGQELYISDPTGTEDNFRVTYTLDLTSFEANGRLDGAITYVVKPDHGDAVAQKVDISARVKDVAPLSVVTSDIAGQQIVLRSDEEKVVSGDEVYADIRLFSPQARPYILKAGLVQNFLDRTSGREVDSPVVLIKAVANRGSTVFSSYLPLDLHDEVEVLNVSGGAAVQLRIFFDLDREKLSQVLAATYNGTLRLTLDNGLKTYSADIPLELRVARIFKLEVIPEHERELEFAELERERMTEDRVLLFKVSNNTGMPYEVVQKFTDLHAEETGYKLPDGAVKISQSISSSYGGKVKYTQQSVLEEGDVVLYESDSSGSPVDFKVSYNMLLPKETKKGNYHTSLSFALIEKQ